MIAADSYTLSGTTIETNGGFGPYGSSAAVVNRGKRSVAVDAQTAEGVAVVKQLAASADVFIQNMRPGVAERLGLGSEVLRAANPSLIYCSISGFGPTGPWSKKAT